MQFQHPLLLWGLLLLILPILVHLLRLRRFRTTPFTNVKILERILAESNKSSRLKKWLLLLSRIGLIAALVIAFCQPFIPSYSSDKQKEIIVFLDNSLSMQSQGKNTNLLQQTIQEVLQFFPEDLNFSLMTHTQTFARVRRGDIQERLLDLEFSAGTLSPEVIQNRAGNLFSPADSTARQLWLLSDFSGWDSIGWDAWDLASVKAVQLRSESSENSSLDTAYLAKGPAENLELRVRIRRTDTTQNLPVSLYNGDTLLAKTGGEQQPDGAWEARFTLPQTQVLHGSAQITDNGLAFDNTLYLSLNSPRKINVISLGPTPAPFLDRIFTPESFNLSQSTLRQLDYSDLERQHMVILNELASIPPPLVEALRTFVQGGGFMVVIPSERAQIDSYNRLLNPMGAKFMGQYPGDILITDILFDHPLYRDVFEKQIENFEYPRASYSFALDGRLPAIITFQNGQPFLAGGEGIYVFTAPLRSPYSNFTQSPLIVPTLYAMGKGSLPRAELYYQVGQQARLDLDVSLQEDEILQVGNSDYSFIPLQQSFARKTRLFFSEEPSAGGNYQIMNQGKPVKDISFNYSRAESLEAFQPVVLPRSFEVHPDIQSLVAAHQNQSGSTSLWKWFVILALLFALAELLIQKSMR